MPETVTLKDGDSYTLTASYVAKNISGVEYRMLAYNGSIPGPLLKIPQGAHVTIKFKNDTDMPTLLHSHGVRMDYPFDGSQTSQRPVPPGGSFSYELKFPDAGMYWYHPHIREDYEQGLGLYGGYLVTPMDSNYWSPVNEEVPLFLSDVLIENNAINISKQQADHALMGRYGNAMLVNGTTNYFLHARKGEVVKFYIVDAANARPFNFRIAGAKMKLVGADGGAYEKDQWVDSVPLGPSERAVVEVLFDKSGSYDIQNVTPGQTYTLGTINVSSEAAIPSYAADFSQLKLHQETMQSIESLRQYFDKAPDKRLAFTLQLSGALTLGGGYPMSVGMMGGRATGMMSTADDGIEWDDPNKSSGSTSNTGNVKWEIIDQETGKMNGDIDWVFKKGQPVKIEMYNDPRTMHAMQHVMHFHGQQFLVLSVNGVRQPDLVWKDSVQVPAGAIVDILLYPTNPGIWMARCHIAEHLEDGMTFTFKVE